MSRISICIPTYEMAGFGAEYLADSFLKIENQDFTDYEVVVSDQSKDDSIKKLCDQFSDRLPLKYIKSTATKNSASTNLNSSISECSGEIIKFLFQDDYFENPSTLSTISCAFDEEKNGWLISGCGNPTDGGTVVRPFKPYYHPHIHFGHNTISSPSVLAIRNDSPLLFDESLIWLMDVDYYKRCHDAFGPPVIVDDLLVINRNHENQVSKGIRKAVIRKELRHVKRKFASQMTLSDKVCYFRKMAKTFK